MASPDEIHAAWETLKAACTDPEYAWALHCNLAVPIMDATSANHEESNQAGAYLMRHLFDCDITAHPNFGYQKSSAQTYHEARCEADLEEPT